MSTNAVQFSASVLERVKGLPREEVVRAHKLLTLELERRIITRTPVDTGFARSNWQAGLVTNESLLPVRSVLDQTAEAVNALAALEPFAVSFVFNNASYVGFLESGSSAQAPHGMVAVSLNEMEVFGASLL